MAGDNIVRFNGLTRLPLSPDVVLEAAVDKLETVLVIGIDKSGEPYFAASTADARMTNWLADRFKHFIMHEVEKL